VAEPLPSETPAADPSAVQRAVAYLKSLFRRKKAQMKGMMAPNPGQDPMNPSERQQMKDLGIY